MSDTRATGLYDALLAARLELTGKIYKKGSNSAQKYSYIGHEGVIEVIRPVMLRHGLLLIEKSVTYVGVTGGEKAHGLWKGVFTLLHVPTGETLEAEYAATTVGNDKAAYVASTALDRTAALRLMQLAGSSDKESQQPFVEDPESDNSGTDETLRDQEKDNAVRREAIENFVKQATESLSFCKDEASLTDWFATLDASDAAIEAKQRAGRAFKAHCDSLKIQSGNIVQAVRSGKAQ